MAKLVSNLSIDFDQVAVLSDLNNVDERFTKVNASIDNANTQIQQAQNDLNTVQNTTNNNIQQINELKTYVENLKEQSDKQYSSKMTFEELTLSVLQIIQDNNKEVLDRLDGTDDDAFTGDIIDGGGATSDGYEI